MEVEASLFGSTEVLDAGEGAIAHQVANYESTSLEVASIEPYLPIALGPIDGQLVRLLADNKLPNRVPLMAGNVRDESGFYLYPTFPNELPNNLTIYKAGLLRSFGPDLTGTLLKSGQVILCYGMCRFHF